MPLDEPFRRRVDAIEAFLDGDDATTLVVTCPRDLGRMLRKLLLRMEEQPDNHHLMIGAAQPFLSYDGFFRGLLERITNHLARHREALAATGVHLPPDLPPLPRPSDGGRDRPREWAERLGAWLSSLAEALPTPEIDSTVVVLDPPSVEDRAAFEWSIGALTHAIPSKRAKLLILDAGDPAYLSEPGEWVRRVERVDFAVRSDEIEGQIARDLEVGTVEGVELRRTHLLAGAFASSAGRFDEAEAHLQSALEECARSGAGPEEAAVLHGLGSMYVRMGRHEEAADTLSEAAMRCLEHDRTPLLGMVLNDMGVALHHMGQPERAGEVFSAARELFRALGHRPGEAHVLDSAARSLVAAGRSDDARGLWDQAREIYRSITAPHLSSVREGGLEQIQAQLAAVEREEGE